MGGGRIECLRVMVSLISDDDEKVVNIRDFKRIRAGSMGFHWFRR